MHLRPVNRLYGKLSIMSFLLCNFVHSCLKLLNRGARLYPDVAPIISMIPFRHLLRCRLWLATAAVLKSVSAAT